VKISGVLYKPLAYLFYTRVKRQRVPYERKINFRALGIKSKTSIKLSLNPIDQGFSREFSLYGFREILNSLFVYYIVRKYRPCVIDVGANLGYYVALEVMAGAEKVIALEPIPLTFSYLRRNVKAYENVITLNVALADREGEVDMIVPNAFNLAHVAEGDRGTHHIRVKSVSLSTLVTELGLRDKNVMLRMDVEGYEYVVLSKNIPGQISLINVGVHPRNYDIKNLPEK